MVAECDATVQRQYPYRGQIRDVLGRGGTDFRPLFERELWRQHQADAIVYFTDGAGRWPAADPGIRTIWALTAGCAESFGCPWGERIEV